MPLPPLYFGGSFNPIQIPHLICARAAAAQQPDLFEVDELEIKRPPPSYTIDTVRELKKRGAKDVHWLIGADMLMYLPKWKDPQALLKETKFVVMARPGV